MNAEEAKIAKKVINDSITARGGCKMFSVAVGKAESCDCPKCQISDLDPQAIADKVNEFVRDGLPTCGRMTPIDPPKEESRYMQIHDGLYCTIHHRDLVSLGPPENLDMY